MRPLDTRRAAGQADEVSFAMSLRGAGFPVALEITPPKTRLPSVLLRRARLLGPCVSAVNVIQRPDRQSSLDASIALRNHGIEPVWHLVVRGHTLEQITAEVERAAGAGITNVLCIRGDNPDDTVAAPTIKTIVHTVCERIPGAFVGATLNQYSGSAETAYQNLRGKLDAGASYVQTQPVLDAEQLRVRAETIKETSPGTRIVAMAMPLVTVEALRRIESRLRVPCPPEVERRIATGEGSAWELFRDTLGWLRESDLVDGVAIMTFEMDPAPEVGARITTALDEAGIERG